MDTENFRKSQEDNSLENKNPTPDGHTPFSVGCTISSVLVALLAAFVIWVEAETHMCASMYINPLPTAWHMGGLIAVPIFLLLTPFLAASSLSASRAAILFSASGYLLATCLFYAVAFLPLLPTGFYLLLMYGAGLLPLAPLLTFLVALWQHGALRKRSAGLPGKIKKFWLAGAAVSVVIFWGGEILTYLSEYAISRALSPDSATQESGMSMLRSLGDEILLAHCYPGGPNRIFSGEIGRFERKNFFDPVQCRILYYRLTGRDYREAERPRSVQNFRSAAEELNGALAGNRGPLLLDSADINILISSSPEGKDAGPGVAYAEWTMIFSNSGDFNHEARCQIVLPPGGVAGRLTLWIDGKEQEAAFGTRAATVQAYENIVHRALDPALLTTNGPDRVLLQCFPVPRNSTMKVKVGFALPLTPDSGDFALPMPYFSERNFAFAENCRISVTAGSNAPLSSAAAALRPEPGTGSDDGRYALRGLIVPADLAPLRIVVPAPWPGETKYIAELADLYAIGTLTEVKPLEKRMVAVVLDTSVQCKELFSFDWVPVLNRLPSNVRIALFAGKTALPPMERDEAIRRWPGVIQKLEFAGGEDPRPNLSKAVELCSREEEAAVLWVHGTIPVSFTIQESSSPRGEAAAVAIKPSMIASLQIIPGVNRLEEEISSSALVRLPSFYDRPVEERLAGIFTSLLYPRMNDRESIFSPVASPDVSQVSGTSHIVRLAYAGEILRTLQEKKAEDAATFASETETALKLYLVTPLTGAVVLENMQQYVANGLNPGNSLESVPTIPEPEEWAMMAVAAVFLLLVYRSRRMRRA